MVSKNATSIGLLKNAKVQNGMRAYLDNAGGAMGFIGKYALDELNISINFDQFYIQND